MVEKKVKTREIIDFYKFIENNHLFRQFSVNELLYTAYDCPLEGSPVDYSTEKNYFCYIIKGGGKWQTPSEEYYLTVGDGVFLKKGVHRVFKILDGDFCALLIFVPDEFIKEVIQDEINHLPLINDKNNVCDSVIPINLDRSLIDYFNSVLNYFSQNTAPSKSLLKIKFKELIINITTSGKNPSLLKCFKEICYKGKKSLKPIMEENFVFNLKLADFANLSDRSLATFHRDFSKIYGTTPGKWLIKKRAEYGKYLLETTESNINEIALDSGFTNASHFIKVFKENYHYSPLKYKKQKMSSP
jgi:AraC-like DNA-binding protein